MIQLPLFCRYLCISSRQESSLISVVLLKFEGVRYSGEGKCQIVVRAARSAILSCFLDFAAILFSRFLPHYRVYLSSLVALPRNSSFATISLKNQRLDTLGARGVSCAVSGYG